MGFVAKSTPNRAPMAHMVAATKQLENLNSGELVLKAFKTLILVFGNNMVNHEK
jgi:hypothetical protein